MNESAALIARGADSAKRPAVEILPPREKDQPFFFTLSAIAVIDEAQWGQLSSVLAFTLFVVCVHAPGLVPIVLSRVAPIQLSTSLTAFGGWVDRNNRAISVTASFAFGVFFLWKGMTGLPG